MGVNEHMQPGGDSAHTRNLKVGRLVGAIEARYKRDRTKGQTLTPVEGRALKAQDDSGQLYFDFNAAELWDVKGIGGSDGQDLVFSEQFHDASGDSDLLNAYQAVSAGDTILHQGRLYIKTTDGIEALDGHCIVNGSFENLDQNGDFEFWTAKP